MDKVLIVDDNQQNCELMRDILNAWGYTSCLAFHGMDAIKKVNVYKPDIVLLDVMIPGMNGFEVCQELKKNVETRDIPIIMLTVLNDVEDRIRGFQVGVDVFLSKPINNTELKYRIAALIKQKKLRVKMENQQQVVKCFLQIMQGIDKNIYDHAIKVYSYCNKVARLTSISDAEINKLLIAAYLHDLGKIVISDEKKHILACKDILSSLKIGSNVEDLIIKHHQENIKEEKLEIQILNTVNRFVNLCKSNNENKDMALNVLKEENKQGKWSKAIISYLIQVINDELFIEKFIINT